MTGNVIYCQKGFAVILELQKTELSRRVHLTKDAIDWSLGQRNSTDKQSVGWFRQSSSIEQSVGWMRRQRSSNDKQSTDRSRRNSGSTEQTVTAGGADRAVHLNSQ